MNICLFLPEEKFLNTKDDRAQHILKILHKKEGDSFTAGIIGSQAGIAKITKIDNEKLYFDFKSESDGKKLYPLSMIIGFPRPIQLKRLLRDMASLGVQEVHLIGTELGEKSYLKSELATTDAANKFLLDGSVQAGSTHIPFLKIHKSLKTCLDSLVLDCSLYALDNVAAKGSLYNKLVTKPQKAIAAIGSERGWTNSERELLQQKGFELLSMGKRILRTETASTVAASLILGAMGVLD